MQQFSRGRIAKEVCFVLQVPLPFLSHQFVKNQGVQYFIQLELVDVVQKALTKQVMSLQEGSQHVRVVVRLADLGQSILS